VLLSATATTIMSLLVYVIGHSEYQEKETERERQRLTRHRV